MTTSISCNNIFCIFYKSNQCILSSNSLDIQGSCTDCIYVPIGEEQLEEHRKELRNQYENTRK